MEPFSENPQQPCASSPSESRTEKGSDASDEESSISSWISFDNPKEELAWVKAELEHLHIIAGRLHTKVVTKGASKYANMYFDTCQDIEELHVRKDRLEELVLAL
ncbi:hypothetical protein [Circoviridae sp.]|nr:hypothetical protein [Circoviridae sp.]